MRLAVSQCENLERGQKRANRSQPFVDQSSPNLGFDIMFRRRDMFGQSSKWVLKRVFAPSPWGVNARGSSDKIFQIAVISEYVSKLGLDPFSDLRD